MRWKLGVLLVALGATLPARPEASPLVVDSLRADLSSAAEFALGDAPGGVAGLDRLDWRRIQVPEPWQSAGLPDHGYAWYRFRFTLSAAAATRPLAFTCTQIRDVDETFLDGVRVGGTGAFPPRYDKGTLQARLYELPASLTSVAGPHVLAVRVFNAGPRPGGITAAPYLDSVSGAFWERTTFESPLALVAAAIFSLGVFALFVFLRDRRQREFLLFFLLTAGVAAYVISWLSLWSRFGVSLSFIFRANFALAFSLSALFTLFFHYFFVLAVPRWMRVVLAIQFAGLVVACVLPRVDDLYFTLPVYYATVIASGFRIMQVLVRKLRRRAPHALTILVGFGLIFLATLRDIAQDMGLILWGARTRYVGLAFLVFAVLFLSVVADRMARLRVAASTDPLTGLPNRAGLFERIRIELARSQRSNRSLALAVLDLDHFKDFNDRFGHLAGDRLLIAAGERLSESVRTSDLAVRFGGEEFVLLLPEISAEEAMRCCERIRDAVRGIRVFGAEAGTTISIGVAVHEPKGGPPPSEAAFLRMADAALYRAKALGRDRVFLAEGPVPREPPRTKSGESMPSEAI
jgi:diguanylate cyclase (GGDEF)-like protein